MAATASSIVGHRFSGSFSSMRITISASLGGQSVRESRIGLGVSWNCANITAIAESALNGGSAGQHLIRDNAERVLVRCAGHFLAQTLLRAHVGRCVRRLRQSP